MPKERGGSATSARRSIMLTRSKPIMRLTQTTDLDEIIQDIDEKEEPLRIAIESGNISFVEAVLKNKSTDVDVTFENSKTAIHMASEMGNLDMCQLLFEYNADLNVKGPQKNTSLHYAAEKGHINILHFLLENGADCTSLTSTGESFFHKAISKGDTKFISEVVEQNPTIIDEETPTTRNRPNHAIHIACSQTNSFEMVKLLLESAADPSVFNFKGNNALHEAIVSGNIDILKLLLEHKESLRVPNKKGMDPLVLSASCKKDQLEILKYLQKIEEYDINAKFNGHTILHYAVATPNLNCIRQLLKENANPNHPVCPGETILHVACVYSQAGAVDLLLEHWANVNLYDKEGYLPIHRAAEAGSVEILTNILSLFDKQIDALTQHTEQSLLHIACRNNHVHVVNFLAEQQVDVCAVDSEKNTPLHVACREGASLKLIKRLLNFGAPTNLLNAKGYTPPDIVTNKRISAYFIRHEIPAPRLRTLDLSETKLSVLPVSGVYWETFEKLHTLDLRSNSLSNVPVGILKAPRLQTVLLEGNPLDDIPSSIKKTNWSWRDIQKYLQTLSGNSTRWSEQKLFVIGDSNSGKETLLHALQGKLTQTGKTSLIDKSKDIVRTPNRTKRTKSLSFEKHPSDNSKKKEIAITREFVISNPKKKLFRAKKSAKSAKSPRALTVTSWNFTSATASNCRFFFTNQGLYLLVFNLITLREKITLIDYWLQLIRLKTKTSYPAADILFVGTHADLPECTSDYIEQMRSLLIERYPSNRYPQIKGLFPVSSRTGKGYTSLQSTIAECGSTVHPLVNPAWLIVHRNLLSLSETTKYISWNDFCAITARNGVPVDQIIPLTQFLCSTSTIMFDDELAYGKNPSAIILNPIWLAGIISSLHALPLPSEILPLNTLLGKLPHWDEYASNIKDALTAIIIKNHVVYEMKNELVLCTWVLPNSIPTALLKAGGWKRYCPSGYVNHGRIFDFAFIPLGFLERIISTIHQIPSVTLVQASKTQLLMKYNSQLALISFIPRRIDQRAYQFTIQSRTEIAKCEEALLFIWVIRHVESLIGSYYSHLESTLTSWVVCSHCVCSERFRENPFLFEYDRCVAAVTSSADPSLYCQNLETPQRAIRIDIMAPDITLSEFAQWVISPSRLKPTETQLGKGAAGAVQLFTLDTDKKVAVKILMASRESLDEEDRINQIVQQYTELTHEIYLMTKLIHPNIIMIQGICEFPLRIVMELAPCGDLHQLLRRENLETKSMDLIACELSWSYRYHIALDIARGLQHLASKNIIHRDIRSPNIFIMTKEPSSLTEPVAKVADFGLSTFALPKATGAKRTWRWLAPEAFHYSADDYDTTSDIYSFAIVLWELIEGKFPFGEYTDDEWDIQEAIVHEKLRPTIPSDPSICHPTYGQLIKNCWSDFPSDRPSWKNIINVLHTLLDHPADQPILECPLPPLSPELVAIFSNEPTTGRIRRFSSFTDATKEEKITLNFEHPGKLSSILLVGENAWLGGKENMIVFYSEDLFSKSFYTAQFIKRWKAGASHIIDLIFVEHAQGMKHVWCITCDAITVWDVDSYENVHTLAMKRISCGIAYKMNGVTSICVAQTLQDRSLSLSLFDTVTFATVPIAIPTPGEKYSCVLCMSQYEDFLLVGLPSHIFIVDLEGNIPVAYWPVQSSARLKSITSIPSKKQIWTAVGDNMEVWNVFDNMSVCFHKTLFGHTSRITSTCLSSDNAIWSCSFDGHIIVWDTKRAIGVRELFLDPIHSPFAVLNWSSKHVLVASHTVEDHQHSTSFCFVASAQNRRVMLRKNTTINTLIQKPPFGHKATSSNLNTM